MSDSIADRANRLLEETEDAIDGLGAPEGSEDLPGELDASGLGGIAEEANELIEAEDADALLEALGLDELEDGTEPDSLLEAIAQGREEQVGDLRVLVKLAKVAEADDEELPTEVGELQEAVEERIGALGEDETDGESEETDGEDEAEESLAESAAEAVGDAVGGGEGDEEGFVEEELESAMRSKLEGFGDELDEARERLDELREGDETDEEDTDEEEAGEADDGSEQKEGEDTPLGSDSRPRSRGTMHSTMAPSPSRRADMGASTRHSTMPDR
ncbi:hypothetical protein [Saliphagus sp. LR7]|uniref:hypothetical protein n=1 Tax=Saliphagus sp. LR7 TaxID=2282654 RepID=UPI000DF76FB2|nr:hypothetical protein [Saliphagus sp. LR7]